MTKQNLLNKGTVSTCTRCGAPCVPASGSAHSRPFRRGLHGLCANCAVTGFLKTTEPLSGILEAKGAECLLNPGIQTQFSNILVAGRCDMGITEIDWQKVVALWNLSSDGKRQKAPEDRCGRRCN